MNNDVSTYAIDSERKLKEETEAKELVKLSQEFSNFPSMTNAIIDYNNATDEEARFVWSVDKMQTIILGEIDNCRPYSEQNITYADFYKKGEEFLTKCSP